MKIYWIFRDIETSIRRSEIIHIITFKLLFYKYTYNFQISSTLNIQNIQTRQLSEFIIKISRITYRSTQLFFY